MMGRYLPGVISLKTPGTCTSGIYQQIPKPSAFTGVAQHCAFMASCSIACSGSGREVSTYSIALHYCCVLLVYVCLFVCSLVVVVGIIPVIIFAIVMAGPWYTINLHIIMVLVRYRGCVGMIQTASCVGGSSYVETTRNLRSKMVIRQISVVQMWCAQITFYFSYF